MPGASDAGFTANSTPWTIFRESLETFANSTPWTIFRESLETFVMKVDRVAKQLERMSVTAK